MSRLEAEPLPPSSSPNARRLAAAGPFPFFKMDAGRGADDLPARPGHAFTLTWARRTQLAFGMQRCDDRRARILSLVVEEGGCDG